MKSADADNSPIQQGVADLCAAVHRCAYALAQCNVAEQSPFEDTQAIMHFESAREIAARIADMPISELDELNLKRRAAELWAAFASAWKG